MVVRPGKGIVHKEEPRILWQDKHIAIILKGAGWIVAVSRVLTQNKGLADKLQERGITDVKDLIESGKIEHLAHYVSLKYKDNPEFELCTSVNHEFGIAHRLDMETSGALMLGKSELGFSHLRNAFTSHKVFKEYICLVHGAVKKMSGEIHDPIYWDEQTNFSSISPEKGQWAESRYTVHGHFRIKGQAKVFSMVRVIIITGRTHQIRVHMAHIGHPLVADPKYNKKWANADRSWCPRLFLHAWRLGFSATNGQSVEVNAPLCLDLHRAYTTNLEAITIDRTRNNELAPSCRIVPLKPIGREELARMNHIGLEVHDWSSYASEAKPKRRQQPVSRSEMFGPPPSAPPPVPNKGQAELPPEPSHLPPPPPPLAESEEGSDEDGSSYVDMDDLEVVQGLLLDAVRDEIGATFEGNVKLGALKHSPEVAELWERVEQLGASPIELLKERRDIFQVKHNKTDQVLSLTASARAALPEAPSAPPPPPPPPPPPLTSKKQRKADIESAVRVLTEMGFDRASAVKALETNGGDVGEAVDQLSAGAFFSTPEVVEFTKKPAPPPPTVVSPEPPKQSEPAKPPPPPPSKKSNKKEAQKASQPPEKKVNDTEIIQKALDVSRKEDDERRKLEEQEAEFIKAAMLQSLAQVDLDREKEEREFKQLLELAAKKERELLAQSGRFALLGEEALESQGNDDEAARAEREAQARRKREEEEEEQLLQQALEASKKEEEERRRRVELQEQEDLERVIIESREAYNSFFRGGDEDFERTLRRSLDEQRIEDVEYYKALEQSRTDEAQDYFQAIQNSYNECGSDDEYEKVVTSYGCIGYSTSSSSKGGSLTPCYEMDPEAYCKGIELSGSSSTAASSSGGYSSRPGSSMAASSSSGAQGSADPPRRWGGGASSSEGYPSSPSYPSGSSASSSMNGPSRVPAIFNLRQWFIERCQFHQVGIDAEVLWSAVDQIEEERLTEEDAIKMWLGFTDADDLPPHVLTVTCELRHQKQYLRYQTGS